MDTFVKAMPGKPSCDDLLMRKTLRELTAWLRLQT
jgi:hypothetical protein